VEAKTRRITVTLELPEDVSVEEVLEMLRERGVKVETGGTVRERILERWRRLGRRARLGELASVDLEDEFQ